jgi:hypothetical protein
MEDILDASSPEEAAAYYRTHRVRGFGAEPRAFDLETYLDYQRRTLAHHVDLLRKAGGMPVPVDLSRSGGGGHLRFSYRRIPFPQVESPSPLFQGAPRELLYEFQESPVWLRFDAWWWYAPPGEAPVEPALVADSGDARAAVLHERQLAFHDRMLRAGAKCWIAAASGRIAELEWIETVLD